MSDGDNATRGPSDPASGDENHTSGDGNQWVTRPPRPAPGAAPWERPIAPGSGSHTDGVTVADLIAKLAADQPPGPRRRRRRAEPEDPPAPSDTHEAAEPAAPVEPVIFNE